MMTQYKGTAAQCPETRTQPAARPTPGNLSPVLKRFSNLFALFCETSRYLSAFLSLLLLSVFLSPSLCQKTSWVGKGWRGAFKL